MGLIHKLSDEVINQIAAGEVVERPAHLVKELVENSLDAGATEIHIDLDQGGRSIRIEDNGRGMSAEDLELSVQRHATSKISKSEDIWNIHSFGFRGEALASIGAVSQLSISSRQEESEEAWEIVCEFGKVSKPRPSGHGKGTLIRMDQLFSNVPARLKFLKSDVAEMTQIKLSLRALAMANPQVSFRVRHKDKLLYFWSATENLKDRVEAVMDGPKLFETHLDLEGFQLRAFVSSPKDVVHQAKQIWTFVRGRHVQDRNLQYAVIEAYRGLLMHGEYPVVALFLECPAAEVDVNIHPTKSQVKFRDGKKAFRIIHRAIRNLLEKAPWLDGLVGERAAHHGSMMAKARSPKNESHQSSFSGETFKKTQFPMRQFVARLPPADLPSLGDLKRAAAVSVVEASIEPSSAISVPMGENPSAESKAPSEPRWARLQVLAQANLTYILTQSDKGVVLVDQHAAHERVIFESLMRDWRDKKTEVQSLLIPMTIDMDESLVEALTPCLDELREFGLEIEPMGPSVLAVRAIPAIVKEESLVQALHKMAQDLDEKGGSFQMEKTMAEVFATMACHSAIRAGQSMSLQQMENLLQQMDEFALSSFCPHGRPVFLDLSFSEIERRFGRLV